MYVEYKYFILEERQLLSPYNFIGWQTIGVFRTQFMAVQRKPTNVQSCYKAQDRKKKRNVTP